MVDFTHLHLHTEYSLLDGANKIKELAKTLKERGVKSVAITDHGNMFGAIDFYKTMKKEGIKPLIGMEAYIHNQDELSDKSTKQRFHLILIAKNEIGYKNLMYLSSMSYIDGFYYYPRINKKILKEHSEGIICTGACLQGEVSWNLNLSERNLKFGAKGYEKAKEIALEYKEIFGDDFYLEIMRHGINHQMQIDDDIIKIAKETNIKIIATNDTHYTFKSRADAHEVFMCIAMGKILDDPNRLKHSVHEFYVKSNEDMQALFLDIPEAISNTQEISDKCNLEIKLGDATPPNFKFTLEYAKERGLELPEPDTRYSFKNDAVFFEHECRKGLEERLKFVPEEKHEEYKKRLQIEIDIINKMNFPGYMVIVWDFINEAKKRGVPVGPGRGSAAGSLVAYALKITDLDPLPYNLLFERFLNPERVSMPDIDVDFCQTRRGEIIDYVIEKYGKYNVAGVITFGKLLAKGVIRDVARVCNMPYSEADAMAKLIPEKLGITLKEAFESEPKIKELISVNKNAERIWKFALDLEGLNRNAGQHAAGVVISNEELWNKTPLFKQSNSPEGHFVTQYSLKYLEDVDLIKFDFLGLKTLTVIDNAIKLIKKRFNKDIIWEQIDKNDQKVYEMIQSGDAIGIFQIESDGMRKLGANLKPDCFEDIVAMLALYRPGPMESGMLDDFVDRKHGRASITYAFKELEPILSPTYGVIVYQEQVMQIVQKIGGFSLGGADLVRRAMGKKIKEEMDNLKGQFVEGAINKGLDGQKANDLFELIVKFAGYGFNKSHSAAYAYITFQTAYLKAYYPAEFMAALLTSEENNVDKIVKYIDESKRLNIDVLGPDINKSSKEFGVITVDGIDKIIFGLSAIKSVGGAAVENILEERKDKDFEDINDLVSRIDGFKVNKKVLESLIYSGAFTSFNISRKCLINNIDNIMDACKKSANIKRNSSESLFADDETMSNVEVELSYSKDEFNEKDLLRYERESTGIYLSGHPLNEYKDEILKINHTLSSDMDTLKETCKTLVVGKIEDFSVKMSKNGKKIGTLNILDLHGNIHITVFERNNSEDSKSNIDILNDIFKDPNKNNLPYAFDVNITIDDQFRNIILNKVLEMTEAKNKKFSTKKLQKEVKQRSYNNLEIVLNLENIDKEKLIELYKISAKLSDVENKNRLILKILNNSTKEEYKFNTDFFVGDNFTDEVSGCIAG
ncbi:DNA polymerase III, alpha subunit [Campylobacter pinnipediorum subsp. caledonicus]|uniref:DNA polymerase III subunit alpha n=1 Tax=Campylobacter pinnipediorum subsp. caledonicus TaxID=1874362 RepID=A0A1S6U7E2_9BACT|nr:DNA polymerase III subunit alpha [Campylobacter pinnipediorum]AQW87661.1 DNA polymerase III, alpha subunit [Campylobacter pinnipediorum subsp. caledonicus]OPA72208.1 DNA polymerase III subunit alpha [Campylobacter pinnipediorum subsp. caledonicus]